MDAYIFGNHDGELPTDLLASAEGDRVRAMARLDGPTHDVFYALEVGDQDGVSVITEALTKHGLVVSGTHIAATNQDKVAMHVVPHITPSHMPPWECYLFLLAGWAYASWVPARRPVLALDVLKRLQLETV